MIRQIIGGSAAGSAFLAIGGSLGFTNPLGMSLSVGGAVILLATLALVA
jgi:hypothetical protein